MSGNAQENTQQDHWIKCLTKGGNLMATAISAKSLIDQARKRHKLDVQNPLELRALGEGLMAGLLLASTCKDGERVSLSVKGDGQLRQVVVDANPDGSVRGFITLRDKKETPEPDEALGPWQKGLLSVTRLKLEDKEPYVGTVPTLTGHLAKDLTFYLSQSEQIPAAIGLAVNIEGGEVKSAGAFLVRVMPGADEKEVALVEKNLDQMESLAAQVSQNTDPTVLLAQVFNDMTFTVLEERPVFFLCNCTKLRVERALKLLGSEELRTMMAENHGAEVSCDFCGASYSFTETELGSLKAQLTTV